MQLVKYLTRLFVIIQTIKQGVHILKELKPLTNLFIKQHYVTEILKCFTVLTPKSTCPYWLCVNQKFQS